MRKIKLSFAFNIIIMVLVALGMIFMLTGIKFMKDDLVLSVNGIEAFKYYTVESNVLMGIMSFIFCIFDIKLLKGKRDYIPNKIYILKLISTVGVVLTMLTTVIFLAPTCSFGFFAMFQNSNLFFHLIVPLLSLITFVFFENTDKIRFRYTFIGVITMVLYSIYYTVNIIAHIENGNIVSSYDWYGFVKGGINNMICVVPIMLGSTYLISYLLWYFNRAMAKKN